MEIKRSPELEAVVRRMWSAFASADDASLGNTVLDEPSLRFILSGDEDWFQGSEVVPIMRERARVAPMVSFELDRLEAYEAGDFGWTALTLISLDEDGQTRSFRQTGVFVLQDSQWKAVQFHTSVGVPPADVFGVDLADGLAALVDSLGSIKSNELLDVAGDRGVVTVMFTDIEGSTQLSQAKGDRQWSHDIQEHFAAVEEAVDHSAGRVVKTLGDGSMAAFPSASGAVDAAIRIQEFDDDDIRVRIGIHSGEAVAVGDDYTGVAIAKAARIASAAAGGETLVSSATRELVDNFEYNVGKPLIVELKGLSGTHQLFPLSGPGPSNRT